MHQTCFHNACNIGLMDVKFAWIAVLNLGCVFMLVLVGRLSEDASSKWTWFLIHFCFSYDTTLHWQNYSPPSYYSQNQLNNKLENNLYMQMHLPPHFTTSHVRFILNLICWSEAWENGIAEFLVVLLTF